MKTRKKRMGLLLVVVMMGVMVFGNLTTVYADEGAGVLAGCAVSVKPEFDVNDIHQGETYQLSISVTNNGTEAVDDVSVLGMMYDETGEYPANAASSEETTVGTVGPGETKTVTVSITPGAPMLMMDGTMATGVFGTLGSKVTINAMASVYDESGIPQGQIASEDIAGVLTKITTDGDSSNSGSTDAGVAETSSSSGTTSKTSPKTGEQVNVMMILAAMMILAGISYIVVDSRKRQYH